MQSPLLQGFVFLVASVSSATADDDVKKALEQLRGSWEVVKANEGFSPKRLIFMEETLTVEFDKLDEKKECRIKIDPTVKPQKIDFLDGKKGDLGIYKLEGDLLTICFSKNRGDRPKEFKSGEGILLVTLKRIKK